MLEFDHGDEGVGAAVPVGLFDQGLYVRVGCLDSPVRHAGVERILDRLLVGPQGCRELDHLGDPRAGGPGDDAGQQGPAVLASRGERLPQLLFDEVGAVERPVGLLDVGQAGLLGAGQCLWGLEQGPPRRAVGDGLAGGLGLAGDPAADLVDGLAGPLLDVEGVHADQGLRGPFGDHIVDPGRAVAGHVGQQRGPGRAERVEERRDGGLVAALLGPHHPAGVVIDHNHEVLMALLVRLVVDPDPAQALQPVHPVPGLGDHPGHHRGHRPPGRTHQGSHRGLGRVRRQPSGLVLERRRGTGLVPCPRHRGNQHPVPAAVHPRGRSFQIDHGRAQIQGPPPPVTVTLIPDRTPTPALRTTGRCPPRGGDPHHQHLPVRRRPLQPHALDDHMFDLQQRLH